MNVPYEYTYGTFECINVRYYGTSTGTGTRVYHCLWTFVRTYVRNYIKIEISAPLFFLSQ